MIPSPKHTKGKKKKQKGEQTEPDNKIILLLVLGTTLRKTYMSAKLL